MLGAGVGAWVACCYGRCVGGAVVLVVLLTRAEIGYALHAVLIVVG